MSYIRLYILSLLTSLSVMASAQVKNSIRVNPEDRNVDMDNKLRQPIRLFNAQQEDKQTE